MLAGPQHAAILAAFNVPIHPAARWRAGFLADDVHADDVGAPMTEPVATSDGRLRLELFEGPLDLLLYLIRKSEIDIHDIPIVDITVQYHAMLQHLRQANLLDLDFAGEYFLMAASLIQIKARMLLPRPSGALDDEPLEDPRVDLVRQLLEYERYREAATMLKERADVTATMMTRPDAAVAHLHGGEPTLDADLLSLARAFRKVLEDKRLRTPHTFAPSRYTVGERIQHVLATLQANASGNALFTTLFDDSSIEEAVVTFLALLELMKRGFVRCQQDRLLDDIILVLVPESERPDADALAPSEFDEPRVTDEGQDSDDAPGTPGDEMFDDADEGAEKDPDRAGPVAVESPGRDETDSTAAPRKSRRRGAQSEEE